MGFLNSILLFGIAGTLVPLLIHLFQRRKTLRMDFPSLRFLRELNQRQMRRLNLRRILLLIVRMLLVATVAFALARPTLKGGLAAVFPEDAPRSVALLIDRSGSMSLRSEEGSLEEMALARAGEILDRLDAGDELRLYAMEEGLFDLGGGPLTPDLARDLLADWRPGAGPTRLRTSLSEAMETMAGRPHPLREVFLISDFAASALDSARLPAAGDLRIYALPVSAPAAGGGSLLGLRRPLRPVLAGRSFTLGVNARGTEDFSADLELDGRHRGSVGLSPGAAGDARAEIALNLDGSGLLEGWWRKPRDRFPLDDSLPFLLSMETSLRALLLSSPGGEAPSAALKRALDPYEGRGSSRLAFRLREAGLDSFGSEDLSDVHLVILTGGAGLEAGGAEALLAFVQRGGGLLIFPDAEGARNLARQLLPRLGGPRALESFEDDVLHLAEFDEAHPIFSELGDAHRRILGEQALYRAFRCEAGPWVVPMRFEGGAPALLAWSREAGRVRLALFDAGPGGGDLPWSSMFLPLIQEMAQEAAGAQQPEGHQVGDELAFSLREVPGEDIRLEILSPEGRVLPPRLDTRRFPPRAVLDRADEVGHWKLREISSAGTRTLGTMAVQAPSSESLLRALPADSLSRLLGLPELLVVAPGEDLQATLRAGHFGKEISATLLLIATVLMLLELWLGRRGPAGEGRI